MSSHKQEHHTWNLAPLPVVTKDGFSCKSCIPKPHGDYFGTLTFPGQNPTLPAAHDCWQQLAQTQESAICVARTDLAKYPKKTTAGQNDANQQGKCQNSKLKKLKIQQFRFTFQKKVTK